MLELEALPLRRLRDEEHLDLAGVVLVGLELPLRADVPAEDHTMGGLIGENASPSASFLSAARS